MLMDMLRESGRRSDAHCIRYHRAAEFIRPGDRVLDVACGLGYGSHILYVASQAKSVLGVDLSDFGIAYANVHYSSAEAVQFRVGNAQALDFIPDHSVDFIAAFETIEHVPEPAAYLRELKRVLTPAGRVMVCAPNNWVDETGKDPNPHHLHVYAWERLVAECGTFFLLEEGFLQTAGGAMKCLHDARKWVTVPVDSVPQEESEWVLLLGMSDPVDGADVPYEETCWTLPDSPDFHVAAFGRDYKNPWLVKGMISIGMRARSPQLLASMQERVLVSAEPESVDYGAALCGRIYACMEATEISVETLKHLEAEIWRYAAIPNSMPHQLRWQVSLLFAGGELARKQGRFDDATAFFTECASRDVAAFSPILGNKVMDALYWLSVFAMNRHDVNSAQMYLIRSVQEAQRLVSGDWLNSVGDPEVPLPFGLGETAELFDKASRSAYLLSVLNGIEKKAGVFVQQSSGFLERRYKYRNNFFVSSNDSLADSLAKQLAQVLCSRSWRITRPFRVFLRFFRHGCFDTVGNVATLQILRRMQLQLQKWHLLILFFRFALQITPLFLALRKGCNPAALIQGVAAATSAPISKGMAWDSGYETRLTRILQAMGEHAKLYGPLCHWIALPFLATGGAEMVALNLCRALRELRPKQSVLLLVTDRNLVSEQMKIPDGVLLLVLDDYLDEPGYPRKQSLLHDLLAAVQPDVFHNINSEVAWNLILEEGARLRKYTRLFASIFMFQFAPDGQGKIGYAANFLKKGMPFLSGLLSDNQRFLADAMSEYQFASEEQSRMAVLYQPCRLLSRDQADVGIECLSKRRRMLNERLVQSSRRPQVLWAGRLDAQKRVDMFLDIVRQCAFADFRLFGQAVLDQGGELPDLPNLSYEGPFSSPLEWLERFDFDAFLFTSRWEGLPNVLLEVGALGIPIIAPTVGGVGELISEDTGYPLTEQPTVDDYEQALKAIVENPAEALCRAERLHKLILKRHSWESFVASVSNVPDY
ncbi:MAG: methyltransferase domain-containing protein, partial [Azoarcus sp.]|nr:methyltransferase domain-containing protein [Azoarcus sp.]